MPGNLLASATTTDYLCTYLKREVASYSKVGRSSVWGDRGLWSQAAEKCCRVVPTHTKNDFNVVVRRCTSVGCVVRTKIERNPRRQSWDGLQDVLDGRWRLGAMVGFQKHAARCTTAKVRKTAEQNMCVSILPQLSTLVTRIPCKPL